MSIDSHPVPFAAARYLLQDTPDPDGSARHLLQVLNSGQVISYRFFTYHRHDHIAGVLLAYMQEPRFAVVWRPSAEDDAVADELAGQLALWLREQEIQVAQIIASELEEPRVAPLQRIGFLPITRLIHLSCPVRGLRQVPPSRLHFRAVAQPTLLLEKLLDESYVDSLDCPELNTLRPAREILESYQKCSNVQPPMWWCLEYEDRPVGLLILDEAESTQFRLNYLGLVREARGIGLGREIMQFALGHATRHGAREMTVSVDERNIPACKLYDSLGFQEVGRERAYLWMPATNPPR